MRKFYKEHALKLYDMGYRPIPIRPKTKIPFMTKGESWQVDITRDVISEWALNGKGSGSVALTGIGAIDFDIKNKNISNDLIKFIRANVDPDILIRIGMAPKFLLPVAADSDIDKKWKNTWYDQDGEKHEIEFLAPGDQYFLAYGIHPDTKEEFRWPGKDVLSVPAKDLPVFDEIDISTIEDEFDRLAEGLGWTRQGSAKKKSKKKSGTSDPLEDLKTPGEMADPAGIAELKAWLEHLPSEYHTEYDLWISTGAAIHHETAGSNEGWLLFDNWSKKSEKYKGRADTVARWESFDANQGLQHGDNCASRGTIIHALQESGNWEKAERVGEKAREEVQAGTECVAQSQQCDDAVTEMNKKHALVNLGGKCRIMIEDKNLDNEVELGFFSVQDFKTLYANKTVPNPKDPKKQKKIADVWIESPKRREFKGIVFEPDKKDVPGYYNLWKGFSITPQKGDWSLYRQHIIDIIADGNEIMGEWIIAWMARIVQDPGGRRPGTSIVMKGGQGTGKGVFVNTFGDIFGEHYLPVSHASQVAGRFNSHLKNKLVVFIDEGFWAGDKQAEGVLKSIITEPYVAIEQKGIDIIRVKNHINLLMASNNDWVVPANIKERRFCVVDVSDREQGNHSYFKDIMDQMYKQGGRQAMLYDLLKMDISDVNLSKFEQTQGLWEQKLHTMPTEMQYWFERLQDGYLLSKDDEGSGGYSEFSEFSIDSGWDEVKGADQHKDYLVFAEDKKDRYPLTPTQFGIFLKRVCPDVKVFKKRDKGKLCWFKKYPVLDECRKVFEQQVNTKIEWDKEDDLNDGLPF